MLRSIAARRRAFVICAAITGACAATQYGATDANLARAQSSSPKGATLFNQQCAGCHGSRAYPGKAPRLKPKKLTPEDVYLRITYGFRKMPAWEDVFTDEELMAITAYVKSDRFSN